MESSVRESVGGIDKQPVNSGKRFANWKMISVIILAIVALLIGIMSYYQANHFNSNIKINGIKVDRLTAEQALQKLKAFVLKNDIYVGEKLIVDGNESKMGFTNQDLPAIKKLLKSQYTFFPSSREKDLSLTPAEIDQYRSGELKKQLEEKLVAMNKTLTVPKDAAAALQQGQIVITKSNDGEQYDVAGLLKDYDGQKYTSDIHLDPVYIQPIKEDSEIVKNEVTKLQDLLQQAVEYKVQNKVYSLKASELIKNASISKDMKVTIDSSNIKKKLAEINHAQSTLNKNFLFKTHSGSVVNVKGQGYGWALDVDKETAIIQSAFKNGNKSISASNIIGHGWKGEGFGYETLTNNGIGDTYAEVSIAAQRIWIYKNGKLVVTSNVVTGKHSTGNDTSKGVWYILYKRSPSTLTGRELGGSESYSVKVNYWAPFTNGGQGFHDASWRSNWSSTAYLNAGSHGCVNTPPTVMKTVYENLSTYEPVVIY